jgi:UDPglucose 6-dehydrogenase
MKIGVVGVGMVGGTISYGFKHNGHEVFEHDIKRNTSMHDVLDTDLVFVCVPTPQAKDGSCDTIKVWEVVEDLTSYRYKGLVVIKSTVTPGTTDALRTVYQGLRLAFCPEFLREKTAYTDFVDYHDVCIIGAYTDSDYELIRQAHHPLPHAYAKVTPAEAEMTKYFSNVFNALRIVFANQMYEVCEKSGVNYQNVKNAVTQRRSIGKDYLACSKTIREFGGNCLPKDTRAFASFVKKLPGLSHIKLFDHIVEDNERIKQRAREEWEWRKNDSRDAETS